MLKFEQMNTQFNPFLTLRLLCYSFWKYNLKKKPNASTFGGIRSLTGQLHLLSYNWTITVQVSQLLYSETVIQVIFDFTHFKCLFLFVFSLLTTIVSGVKVTICTQIGLVHS